jgi:hypothetical protein
MFAHPWANVPADFFMFGLCGASLVILSSFIRSGSRIQRVGAILLATLPVWVVAHYVVWMLT